MGRLWYSHTAILPKVVIFTVKVSQRLAELAFSEKIVGKDGKKPWEPIDRWTAITFVVSMMLGYLYPNDFPFFLTLILALDVGEYLFMKKIASGEHLIMFSVASALGFILGVYLRTGVFI